MREELLKAVIPTESEFISKAYIDGLIANQRWSSHGDYLEVFIDDKKEEDFPDSLKTLDDYSEIIVHPDFRSYLERWLPLRYRYAVEWLTADVKELLNNTTSAFPGKPLVLSRSMLIDQPLIDNIIAGEQRDIGVYWGSGNTMPWGAEEDDSRIEVVVKAAASLKDIDWHETLVSRMDYTSGDSENEFQLRKGASPTLISLYSCEDYKEYQIPNSLPSQSSGLRL